MAGAAALRPGAEVKMLDMVYYAVAAAGLALYGVLMAVALS
ncbi:MAG: hypothetical protein AAFP67_09340 [Pseudomonadota bacterium]